MVGVELNPSLSAWMNITRSVAPPLRKTSAEVLTPEYGLNTPPGSDSTASTRLFSTSLRRNSRCAPVEPNSTPSGTTTPHRPPLTTAGDVVPVDTDGIVVVEAGAAITLAVTTLADLATIEPRYEPSGRQWAMRLLAAVQDLAVTELYRALGVDPLVGS